MHIWLFCGYSGCGRTTAAAIFASILGPCERTGFFALATPLKDFVASLYNLERTSLETAVGKSAIVPNYCIPVIQLLIQHANATRDGSCNPGIFAEWLSDRILDPHQYGKRDIVICDWRFKAERDILQERFPLAKIHTIRIVHDSMYAPLDPIEHDLDTEVTDYIIHQNNNGTLDELYTKLYNVELNSQMSISINGDRKSFHY